MIYYPVNTGSVLDVFCRIFVCFLFHFLFFQYKLSHLWDYHSNFRVKKNALNFFVFFKNSIEWIAINILLSLEELLYAYFHDISWARRERGEKSLTSKYEWKAILKSDVRHQAVMWAIFFFANTTETKVLFIAASITVWDEIIDHLTLIENIGS